MSAKPRLKLGLDVHLEFIMAVAQKDHANPHAPRKFTRDPLVAQVKKWVAEDFQVFCVQESCGFGFVLHRELVAAGAQSFLITPIALNGKRKGAQSPRLNRTGGKFMMRLCLKRFQTRRQSSPTNCRSETERNFTGTPPTG